MPNISSPLGAGGAPSWPSRDFNDKAEASSAVQPGRLPAAVPGTGDLGGRILTMGSGESHAQLQSNARRASADNVMLEDDDIFHDCTVIDGPPLDVEAAPLTAANALARQQTETQEQEQQAGIFNWFLNSVGNAVGNVVFGYGVPDDDGHGMPDHDDGQDISSMGPTLLDLASGVVGSAVSVFSRAESLPAETPKPLTLAQKNAARLEELNGQIDDRLHMLDVQLKRMGAATEHLHAPVRRNSAQLGIYGNVQCFNYTVRGYLSAAVPFLGKLAAVTGASTAVMAVAPLAGGPLVGAGIKATAALTGAYAAGKSIQSLPGEATASGGNALTKTVYEELDFLMTQQKNLLEQESARTLQSQRIEGGIETRKLHIVQLKTELAQLAQLGKPESVAAGSVPSSAPRHSVALGSGAQRTQTLSVVARARDAFATLFGPIGRSLASVGRFISSLPSLPGRLLDRWAAAKQEQAYMDNLLQVLGARRDNSLVGVVGAGAMVRAEGVRSVLTDAEIDAQLHMGENLVRALQEEPSANFGRVLYKPAGSAAGHAVAATLTTARAIAWYAEAIAHAPVGTGGLASQITRNADGSMTVSDPGMKLFSFLRSVPTAYAAAGGDPSTLRIDDHRQGMPGAMNGMEFRQVLDGAGNSQLQLAFTQGRGTPVFKPLANENAVILSARKAIFHANSGQLPQPLPDFSLWTQDEREAHVQRTEARLKEQQTLLELDAQQLERLQDWSDPEFQAGVLSSMQPSAVGNRPQG
jgi:gas vesicle protein